MQAGCEPYPPQTGFDLKGLFDYEVKAILWSYNILKCQCSKGCPNTAVEYISVTGKTEIGLWQHKWSWFCIESNFKVLI